MEHLRQFNPETYHKWRWRAMAIWAIALSVVVIVSLSIFRNDTARIGQLEHTNCSLKQFLYSARNARLSTARDEIGQARKVDLQAAHGYQVLADRIGATGHSCDLPHPPNP